MMITMTTPGTPAAGRPPEQQLPPPAPPATGPARTRPRRRVRRWRVVLLVLLALVVGTMGLAAAAGDPVLILGVDRREGDRGRSDTMLLVAPRLFGGGLKLLSIPRDTRVELPGRGTAKINAAYAYDGPEASAQAVARLLDIPVPDTMVLDFEAVAAVVDAVGGVTLTIERPMRYQDPYQDLVIDLDPGTRRLSGEEALGYVRFRSDAQGDIGRTARQRAFVQALLAELLSPRGLTRLPAVYAAVRSHVETDMGPVRLVGFGLAAAVSALWGVDEAVVPGRTATIGGASYWIHDPEETAQLVDRWFRGPALSRPEGRLPAAGAGETGDSPPGAGGEKAAGGAPAEAGREPAGGGSETATPPPGEREPGEDPGQPDGQTGDSGGEPAWDPGEDGAMRLVEDLLGLLAAGDPQALAAFLEGRTWQPVDAAGAGEILFLFHDYLDAGRVEVRLLAAYRDQLSSQYDFGLFETRDGRERVLPVHVLYRSEPPQVVLSSVLLNQGPWVRAFMSRFLDLLRAGDAAALARFLTVDDLDYPEELAQQVIDRYAAETAVDTLAFQYDGFGPLEYRSGQVEGPTIFRFTITGRDAGGGPLEHPVAVVVGDGLMGLQDPWVPHPPGP